MDLSINRCCAVTRKVMPKHDLFRIVKTKDHKVVIDDTYLLPGRGSYILKDKDVILLAKKRNVLARALRIEIDSSIYDELLAKL